jgi:hypothetical protein
MLRNRKEKGKIRNLFFFFQNGDKMAKYRL